MKKNNYFLSFAFIIVFVNLAYSQGPPAVSGPKKNPTQAAKSFSSLEGEFSIDLPNDVRGYAGIRPNEIEKLGTGGYFSFDKDNVKYEIGYVKLTDIAQRLPRVETQKLLLNSLDGKYKEFMKITSIEQKTFLESEAIDVKASFFGRIFSYRYIFIDNKVFFYEPPIQIQSQSSQSERFSTHLNSSQSAKKLIKDCSWQHLWLSQVSNRK